MKFSLWLINRILTWTGVLYVWKRFRATRTFWVWIVLINMVSIGGLGLLFFWLHARSTH